MAHDHANGAADEIARLEAAFEGTPHDRGSRGQLTIHPLIAESRQQRDLLARLLGRVAWPSASGAGPDLVDELCARRYVRVHARRPAMVEEQGTERAERQGWIVDSQS